jgi:hypothetical protein
MNSKTPVSGRGFLLLNFQADPLPLEERELVLPAGGEPARSLRILSVFNPRISY